jgi:hypothetical protein
MNPPARPSAIASKQRYFDAIDRCEDPVTEIQALIATRANNSIVVARSQGDSRAGQEAAEVRYQKFA